MFSRFSEFMKSDRLDTSPAAWIVVVLLGIGMLAQPVQILIRLTTGRIR